jgi:hypothetical protein
MFLGLELPHREHRALAPARRAQRLLLDAACVTVSCQGCMRPLLTACRPAIGPPEKPTAARAPAESARPGADAARIGMNQALARQLHDGFVGLALARRGKGPSLPSPAPGWTAPGWLHKWNQGDLGGVTGPPSSLMACPLPSSRHSAAARPILIDFPIFVETGASTSAASACRGRPRTSSFITGAQPCSYKHTSYPASHSSHIPTLHHPHHSYTLLVYHYPSSLSVRNQLRQPLSSSTAPPSSPSPDLALMSLGSLFI